MPPRVNNVNAAVDASAERIIAARLPWAVTLCGHNGRGCGGRFPTVAGVETRRAEGRRCRSSPAVVPRYVARPAHSSGKRCRRPEGGVRPHPASPCPSPWRCRPTCVQLDRTPEVLRHRARVVADHHGHDTARPIRNVSSIETSTSLASSRIWVTYSPPAPVSASATAITSSIGAIMFGG